MEEARRAIAHCELCAHRCGADRTAGELGPCRAGPEARIFSSQVEVSDELELSPVFAIAFGGCDLRCSFCITGAESWNPRSGRPLDVARLSQDAEVAVAGGVRSLMILGGEPTLHLPAVLELVAALPEEPRLIWKTNAHGTAVARELLEGVFDLWVVDFKFGNDACAERLSGVPHYTATVRENLVWAGTHADPIHVIEQVEPALFIFKDFHPFLAKGNKSANVGPIRKLKDVAAHLKNSYKTIILVSPVQEIPEELEKEITVMNHPLPTRDDLAELLDRIIAEVRHLNQVVIDLDEGSREKLLQAAFGLTLGESENVFAKIIVQEGRLDGGHVGEVFAEKQQIIRKSGLLEYYPSHETFAQVGGLGVMKEWLRKRAAAFTEESRAFGLPPPKGILLLGVQGCGKSLCAKAVSSRWQQPLLRFDMGRMFGSLVGSSEENVRRAIAVAESVAPAVLWVDEIDKAFAGSQGSGGTDGGTTARVFGTFLTWLSEKTSPVFVVATANDISQLPPELLRKGRLDEIFFVDLPSDAEREEIFRIHLERRHRDPDRFSKKK